MATNINTIYRLTMLFSGFFTKIFIFVFGNATLHNHYFSINASQFIVFFVLSVCKLLNELKNNVL